jgi:hypothetical protein
MVQRKKGDLSAKKANSRQICAPRGQGGNPTSFGENSFFCLELAYIAPRSPFSGEPRKIDVFFENFLCRAIFGVIFSHNRVVTLTKRNIQSNKKANS